MIREINGIFACGFLHHDPWNNAFKAKIEKQEEKIFVIWSLKEEICSPSLSEKGSTLKDWLIVLGFNDTSALVGHFVSSPRERETRDRRDRMDLFPKGDLH